VKSTIRSAHSAGASRTVDRLAGARRNPPSAPICQIGSAALAGRVASGSLASFSISARVCEEFRTRKRYRRASTFSDGQVRPLTMSVLPNVSGFRYGAMSLSPVPM